MTGYSNDKAISDAVTDRQESTDAPLVSVVIVTYNQERWVEDAIRSAANQEYRNLEVVVADDGSTDGTRAIIQRVAAELPNRVIPRLGDTNLGVTGNSNRGLRACRGTYVAFSGGDDILLPGKIAAQVAWLECDPGRVLCGHDVEIINDAGVVIGQYSSHLPLRHGHGAASIIRRGLPFPAISIMVRRRALPPFGFDERIAIASDRKLCVDCLVNGGEYGTISGVYSRYRRHEGSLTDRTIPNPEMDRTVFEDRLLILTSVEARHPSYAPAVRQGRNHVFAEQSWQALRRDELRESRRHARRALRESFRGSWRAWLSLVLSHSPRWLVVIVRRSGSWLYRHSRWVQRHAS